MSKKWKINENKISEEIIKNNPDQHPVILQILSNRGFKGEEIKKFLEPDYKEDLHDPFLFNHMQEAVELIKKYLDEGEKIVIYGDYDADGITAIALLFKTLEFLIGCSAPNEGAEHPDIYIPDRTMEGYGLNEPAIRKLSEDGAKLIITVDNGIRNVEEVKLVKELGMEIVVTDHHEPPDELPDCLILDPKVNDETYPFKELAGVGVAFKLAQALLNAVIARSPDERSDIGTTWQSRKNSNVAELTGLPRDPSPPNGGSGSLAMTEEKIEAFEKWLLDLVAIGTIADCVPLTGENRVLVKYGLMVLNKTQRIGLQKLIEVAQSAVDRNGPRHKGGASNRKEIDSWQVGFQLAPRLNAAGRLDHANNAYQLLITEDEQEALSIAKSLNSRNQERQKITEEIFKYTDQRVNPDDRILFAVWPGLTSPLAPPPPPYPLLEQEGGMKEGGDEDGDAWPAGVMGLVSGKLTEKYYRPSLAITDKNGEVVGSGRSIPEFDITEMLEECNEHLSAFGGHKQACGFSLKTSPPTPLLEQERGVKTSPPTPLLEQERGVKGSNLEKFLEKAKEIAERELKDVDLTPTLNIDLKVDFKDVDENLFEALQRLRPFGVSNPQPKFISRDLQVADVFKMGSDGQHIKLKVKSKTLKILDAVGFSVPEEWKEVSAQGGSASGGKVGDRVDLVYYIDRNEWNGRSEIQLKIVDLKAVSHQF